MSLADDMAAVQPGAPSAPLDAMLGIHLVSYDATSATFAIQATDAHHNPTGVVHGGVLASLADAAMGHLACRLAGPCTNIDLQVRFLRPVTGGRLTATARVVRRGRRVTVLTADVAAGDRLLATVTSAFVPLPP